MTDRPMDASATEHPEEGLIHAWLDDALGAAEAERIEAHVRDCAECRTRVAEARGLIAGASRIVAALDDAPAATRPGWATSAATAASAASDVTPITRAGDPLPGGSLWRWLRVTPGRAALAATILVAVGITLTHERVAEDSVRSVTSTFNPQKSDVPAMTPAEAGPGEGAKEAAARDALLDSAVAGNVARSQGRARIEAVPGAAIPQAPPSRPLERPSAAGAERVARGRAVAEAQRETANVMADRLRVGTSAAAAGGVGSAEGAVAPTRAAAAPAATQDAMMAKQSLDAVGRSCVRLDSPDADARWADQQFPLVLAIDSGSATGPRTASVLTVAGQPTQIRATWRPRANDSVSIALRRIGYSGSIVLGPDEGARSGVAVSAASPTAIQEDVVARIPSAQSRARAEGARDEVRRAEAAQQPAPAAGPPVRQLRVTARSIPCPQ
jgi:hypothetical protein